MRMFLQLCRVGWYVVRKARIFSALSLFVEVLTFFHLTLDVILYSFYQTVGVVSRTEACFELGDILNKRFR